MKQKTKKSFLRFLPFTLVVAIFLVLVAGLLLTDFPQKASAAPASITINSVELILANDADANGYANIGDTIEIDADISNTDNVANGDCTTAVPTATVDLSAYGGVGPQALAVTTCNNGVNDIWELDFVIVDAAGSGIDVVADDASSAVTVTATDSDDVPSTLGSNNIGDGVIDTTANGVDTIAPVFATSGLEISTDGGVLGVAAIGDDVNVNATVAVADGDTITWDASPIGGGATEANNSAITLAAGIIDDGAYTFSVTATDDAGNILTQTTSDIDATTVSIDNIGTHVTVPGTLTLTNDVHSDGFASTGDTITYAAGTETTGDGVTWTADLSLYGFSATAAPGDYVVAVPPPSLDASPLIANEEVLDDAGNTFDAPPASVTTVGDFGIDNVPPELDTISIASTNVIDSTYAKAGDTVVLYFHSTLGDITPTVVFYSGGNPVTNAVAYDMDHGNWTASYVVDSADTDGLITFTIDYYDPAFNDGIQETTTDDLSEVTVDNTPPSISQITFKTQAGAFPSHDSVLWYNYPGDTFEAYVEGNEELNEIKICVRSLAENVSTQTCSVADFTNSDNYVSSGAPIGGVSYTFTGTDVNSLPGVPSLYNSMTGYSMNVQIIDAAGNLYTSPLPTEALVMVYNLNPKDIDPNLDNLGTTDWSTIDDFTDVTGLTFRAEDGVFLGQLGFPGSVDLTDQATVTALQDFSTNVMIGGGDAADGSADIGINATALAALNVPADLSISVPGAADQPGLVVYDDTGTACGYIANDETGPVVVCGDTITDVTWDGLGELIEFSTDGFSSFGADSTAPTVVTYGPADDATGIAIASNLVLTFDQNVVAGTGNVYIKKTSDNSTVATIDIASGQVTFNGTTGVTINPTANLANNTGYYVQIDDTAIADTVGNAYAGIADTTTWSFTTVRASGGGGGTYTPSPVTSSNKTEIPGCGMRTTGFSTTSGQSCVNNIPHDEQGTPSDQQVQTPLAPASPFCLINARLAFGSRGEEVKCLQTRLNTKIASALVTDGIFGRLTSAAVVKFQLANKLVGDAIVGPLTRAVLNK